MSNLIVEHQDLLNPKEIAHYSSSLFWSSLPLHYNIDATSSYKSYSTFYHSIIERWKDRGRNSPIIDSPHYDFFKGVLDNFCTYHSIEYTNIYRMALNLTIHGEGEYVAAPHVDHEFPHSLAIVYLNDCAGDTVLFNNALQGGEKGDLSVGAPSHYTKPIAGMLLNIKDGLIYHTAKHPDPGEYRLVCVITYN